MHYRRRCGSVCIAKESDRELHVAIVDALHAHVKTYTKALQVVASDALLAVRVCRTNDLALGDCDSQTDEYHFSFVLAPTCQHLHYPACEMYCILDVTDGEPTNSLGGLAGLTLQLAREAEVVRMRRSFGMPLNIERCTKSGSLKMLSTDQYAAYIVFGHSREMPDIRCNIRSGRVQAVYFDLLDFQDVNLHTVRTTGIVVDPAKAWSHSLDVVRSLRQACAKAKAKASALAKANARPAMPHLFGSLGDVSFGDEFKVPQMKASVSVPVAPAIAASTTKSIEDLSIVEILDTTAHDRDGDAGAGMNHSELAREIPADMLEALRLIAKDKGLQVLRANTQRG